MKVYKNSDFYFSWSEHCADIANFYERRMIKALSLSSKKGGYPLVSVINESRFTDSEIKEIKNALVFNPMHIVIFTN